MQNYYETILNYFVNRETNAFGESFNAKLKRSEHSSGESEIDYFLFLDYAN